MKKLINLFLALTLLLVITHAWAAGLTADIDRSLVTEGETFNLTLTLEGDGNGDIPDITPLQRDFNILETSRSNQISIINGVSSKQSQWLITLSPKHAGTLTIPAIRFGKAKSQAMKVEVNSARKMAEAGQPQDIFLETSISPKKAYIQGQTIHTIRLFYDNELVNGTLTEPEVSDAIVTRLGKDTNYRTTKYGRRYQVIERRYAIFPQQAGTLTIPPVVFTGEVNAIKDRNSRSRIRSFFNTQTRPIRVSASSTTVQVNPKPKKAKGQWWLPAKQLTLEQSWSNDPVKFQVGEPITRTITMKAVGLNGAQLPKLNNKTAPKQLKSYPDQPQLKTATTNEGIIGVRIEKLAYIPTSTGKITLPQIKIPWWNTETNKAEVAVIPSKTITILPGKMSSAASTGISFPQKTIPTGLNKTAEVLTQGNSSANQSAGTVNNYWKWLAIIFLIAWLASLTAWLRLKFSVKHKKLRAQQQAENNSLRQARNSLKSACLLDDAIKVKTTLVKWAKVKWPEKDIRNLGDVTKHVQTPELSSEINTLRKNLYSPQQETWDGKEFWALLENDMKVKVQKKANGNTELPALYR